MEGEREGVLIYKTIAEVSVPTQLECFLPVRAGLKEVQNLTAKLVAIRGQVQQLQLKAQGKAVIRGRLLMGHNYLQLLEVKSPFKLELRLPRLLPPGHLELRAEVTGLTETMNQTWYRAELIVVVAVKLTVRIKAAVPSPWAQCRFQPALLKLIHSSNNYTFRRELFLPLDPPGSKILLLEIEEQSPEASLTEPILVSGVAREEIVYWGLDQRLHSLNHLSSWSYVWPLESKPKGESLRVTVEGEIAAARILAGGHTLVLSIKENINVQDYQEAEGKIMVAVAGGETLPTKTVRLPVPAAKLDFVEPIFNQLPLQGLPIAAIVSEPQVRLNRITARTEYGQVLIKGELEVNLSYIDCDSREQTYSQLIYLTKILISQESQPDQWAQIEAEAEILHWGPGAAQKLNLKILCSGRLYLCRLKDLAAVVATKAAAGQFQWKQIQSDELVGQSQSDLLLERELELWGRDQVILDHALSPKIDNIRLGSGVLYLGGEIQLTLYGCCAGGKGQCLERALPWETVINLPGADPGCIPQVDVKAQLMPFPSRRRGDNVLAQVAVTIKSKIYRPSLLTIITGEKEQPQGAVEPLVLGIIKEEIKLELLIKPRSWLPRYRTELMVEIAYIDWKVSPGAVEGLGEFIISVSYGKSGTAMQFWQEKRPFQLSLPYSQGREGQEVRGNLVVASVFQRTGLDKKEPGFNIVPPYLRAHLLLAADLVIL
ncbi:MAG TPA: DUF3794 domain-containing protein [bacterium]|nr:DUF3794 domain-containing protein [bacterium]